jgi:hypothetical protein
MAEMKHRESRGLSVMALLFLVAACGAAGVAEEREARAVAGDSILDMPLMVERFQARNAAVAAFGADAPRTREELIERFAMALRDGSVAALRQLTLSEAEFAYLYFPTSRFARPPYAQPPEVNWLLLEQNGLKGETRLLRHYGGTAIDVAGHSCEADPAVEGRNIVWSRCRVALRQEDGTVLEDVRLFGSIVERDGRFRFVSLANKL